MGFLEAKQNFAEQDISKLDLHFLAEYLNSPMSNFRKLGVLHPSTFTLVMLLPLRFKFSRLSLLKAGTEVNKLLER